MNKQDLIDEVAAVSGLPKTTCKQVIDSTTAVIEARLCAGDTVAISGFGTFKTKKREARLGRNPSTGASVDIPACRLVAFSVSDKLKQAVK